MQLLTVIVVVLNLSSKSLINQLTPSLALNTHRGTDIRSGFRTHVLSPIVRSIQLAVREAGGESTSKQPSYQPHTLSVVMVDGSKGHPVKEP
ncbi:hypothetical protein JR316_0007596 [Psilocybe cubensis]|uniref:Uncharacterized protein n=1 Tax=Psilocybe cubensis TaxID=181762 RepID=A0ACB8GUI2_PSICU|nr:hypothetical protein JR316_0007596 [Psilocybe cubensis]KAH9479022.1 hypothetical protein JR316_0007596 [Psilocybe cubensis]